MNSSPRMTCVTPISMSSTICEKLYVGYPSLLIRMKSSSASSPAESAPRTTSFHAYRLSSGTRKRRGRFPYHPVASAAADGPSPRRSGLRPREGGRCSRNKNALFSSSARFRKESSSSSVYGSPDSFLSSNKHFQQRRYAAE